MTTKLIENCTCGRCTATDRAANDAFDRRLKAERATRRGPAVSVAEVVAAVNALVEKSKLAEPADPNEGRTVAGLFLSPRGPDGKSGGEVQKIIRVGPKPEQQFAEPRPHSATANDDRRGAPGDVGDPAAGDELAELRAEAKRLQAIRDDPATGAIDRQRAGYRLTAITLRIEQLEVALHPVPQAGRAPTAGARQFAEPTPAFKLSDVQRAEHEAQATALRAKLAAPGLSPGQRIRLEQELQHLEDLLRLDASPTPDPRPFEERRVQG